ncbi:MAG TPA: AraC family transcriptional regulator [Capsulimonadaceae bacterium]|nr:AraC family transcriptional regulator [Capsulimonadaceae bacterium]
MRILRWDEIAEGRDFHAALASLSGRAGTSLHTHDFAEMMYVLAGRGIHPVNQTRQSLEEGDLLLIRPRDRHEIHVAAGENLAFINIAFPMDRWAEFHQVAGLAQAAESWAQAPLPPTVAVPTHYRQHAAEFFHRTLRAYHENPGRLELIGFWAQACRLLLEDCGEQAQDGPGPDWLAPVCRAMRDEHNMREGLPRMLSLSGVSAGHLSRTLKEHRGQTPTEFLIDLRLARAATLLSTTSREILAISHDIGFGSLSYFYRLFHERFGETPAQYRVRLRRPVAP